MNPFIGNLVLVGLLLVAGIDPLSAQTGRDTAPASFGAIAGRALAGNFELQSRRTAYEAQISSIRAVNAGLRPRIDFDAYGGSERVHTVDNAGVSDRSSGATTRATLSLRQPLYDGNAISSEAERQARIGNLQYFDLRQAEDGLLLELARAWIDIERQRALIEVARGNLAAHERLVGLVQSRVQSGVSRGVDLDQANSRLSSARLALASDQGLLADALARYQRAAAAPAPARLAPLTVGAASLPASEREAIENAIASAPALRAAAERAAAVDAELRGRRSAYAPRIALEGRHDLNARTAVLRDTASSSLLLTLSYNLYAGGGDEARIQDAALRLQSSRQQFQDGVVALQQTVSATWADAARQRGINANARAYVESVVKTRDVYRVQYEIGQRSLLDLLNTENEVAQAQRLQLNSASDLAQAQIRLLALTGRLTGSYTIARNDLQPLIAPAADPFDSRTLIVAAVGDASRDAAPAERLTVESVTPRPPATATPPSVIAPLSVPSANAAPARVPAPAVAAAAAPTAPRSAAPTSAAPTSAAPTSAAPTAPGPAAPPVPAAPPAPPVAALRLSDAPPAFDPRLPPDLAGALRRWRDGVAAGRELTALDVYATPDSASIRAPWAGSTATGKPAGAQTRRGLQLVAVERTDDPANDKTAPGTPVQLSVLSLFDDAGTVRCVRSAQIWRLQSRFQEPPQWRIARERALPVADGQCRRGAG